MLFIASGFNGILLAVNNVAVQQLMGSLSRPEQRPRNFSNLALTGAASNFTAPLVAGLSVDQFGHAGACLVMLAVAVAGLLALAAWGAVLPAGKGRAGREEKARHRLPIRRIWPLLAVSALAQTCTDLFLFYVPVYGRGIGLSASAIGVLAAAFGAASLLVRAVTPSVLLRLGEVRMLAYSFYLAAAGFALIPFFDSAYPLIAVSALIGLGAGCGQPVTMMMMVARATEGRSGEMLGLQLTANAVVRTSGPVVLGAAGSLFGLGPVFIAGAVLMALGGATSERAALRPQRTRQSSGAP
jgi:predicted MFS family arabinose efflux permease